MIRYAVLFATVLTGCQTMVHPGKSPDQVAQDNRECRYEARKATASIINPMDKGWEEGRLERECLEVRGYVRTAQ